MIFANKTLSDFEIPVILNTIYIHKEKIGRVKYYATSWSLRTSYQYRSEPRAINTALNRELSEIPDARKSVAPLDKAEASKVLAQYLADVVQKGLDNVLDTGGDISTQIGLANKIVDLIQNTTQEADFATLSVDQHNPRS